jgi:peptidoglycan hydrolase-like protein with peptidoglycan-binding domain
MRPPWLVVVALAVLACLGAGWLAARAFESPAQRQARARPPAPEPIVAAVTLGTLADEVMARAHIAPERAVRIRPGSVADRAVVTGRPVAPGSSIGAGAVLLSVNGRPLFVLPGRFRFYRDIAEGKTGPDVAQLQAGLTAAGLLPAGTESGGYGPATQAAVRALYAAAGAEPETQPAQTSHPPAHGGGDTPPAPPQLPIVPTSEVVVAPSLPATLASSLPIGADVRADRPVATLTGGPLVAHAGVAASVVGRIRPGMEAQLIPASGHAVPTRVRTVQRAGGSRAGDLHDVTLDAAHGSLPAGWKGRTVLARIVTTLVRRRALIVPTRAVSQSADGDPYVLAETQRGHFERVPVRVLGSLAGRTAVAPLTPHALAASDRVRVG